MYGYLVSPEVHRAVTESTSPGGAYNRLVKGTGRSTELRCAYHQTILGGHTIEI